MATVVEPTLLSQIAALLDKLARLQKMGIIDDNGHLTSKGRELLDQIADIERRKPQPPVSEETRRILLRAHEHHKSRSRCPGMW